jgi:WD40 repeat protein
MRERAARSWDRSLLLTLVFCLGAFAVAVRFQSWAVVPCLVVCVVVGFIYQVESGARHARELDERRAVAKLRSPGTDLERDGSREPERGIHGPDGAAREGPPHPATDPVLRAEDLTGSSSVQTLLRSDGPLGGLAFHPRTGALAVGRSGGRVEFWTGAGGSGPAAMVVAEHPGALDTLRFSPDGRWMVTAGRTGEVRLWDTAAGSRPVAVAEAVHGRGRRAGAPAADVRVDGRVVTAGPDGKVRVWDVPTGTGRGLVTVGTASFTRVRGLGRSGGVLTAAWSPDGALAVCGGRRTGFRQVRTWRVDGDGQLLGVSRRRRQYLGEIDTEPFRCLALAFGPGGRLLATACDRCGTICPYDGCVQELRDSMVILWDLADPEHPECLASLVERGGDTALRHWKPQGTLYPVLAGHAATVRCLAISTDGSRLVTGGDDGAAMLWELSFWARPAHLRTFLVGGPVRHVALSPDHGRLVIADAEGTVTVRPVI